MKHQVNFEYAEYNSEAELSDREKKLLTSAKTILKTAYAPYSNYLVGCAMELANGEMVCGTNQENMAFPSGLCAERVALFAAGARFPGVKILTIAISSSLKDIPSSEPPASCGACRQVMLEYELNQDGPIRVIFQGISGKVIVVDSAKDLLPLFFREDRLRNGI